MTTVRQVVQVMPGHRVELVVPEVSDGNRVEVVIHTGDDRRAAGTDVLTFIDSLPDGPRAAADWEQYEDQLREDRESWGP